MRRKFPQTPSYLHRSPLYSFDDGDKRKDNDRKKLLGESEIEAVLRRLDRLTQEEGRMTMAQTLEVVYGLVNNVKVVINGTQRFSAGNRRPHEELS